MKPKLDLTKLIKTAGNLVYKLRGFLVVLAFIGLVGYAGYLVSQIVSLQPDQAYLQDQRKNLDDTKISFDKKTVDTINNLEQVNPTIDLSHVGKTDPFSP